MARNERKFPRSIEFTAKHNIAEYFENRIDAMKEEIESTETAIKEMIDSGTSPDDWSIKYRKNDIMLNEKEIEILEEFLSDL